MYSTPKMVLFRSLNLHHFARAALGNSYRLVAPRTVVPIGLKQNGKGAHLLGCQDTGVRWHL